MVFTRKKKYQNKGQLSHLNETLGDCFIGNNTIVEVFGIEDL